jgi:hypothetical protein
MLTRITELVNSVLKDSNLGAILSTDDVLTLIGRQGWEK